MFRKIKKGKNKKLIWPPLLGGPSSSTRLARSMNRDKALARTGARSVKSGFGCPCCIPIPQRKEKTRARRFIRRIEKLNLKQGEI